MGGKLTYEFIRLNLPGSLPNLSMLSASISDNRFKITEGQFRFDAFRHYMKVVDVQYAFGSEDCTGVIKKSRVRYKVGHIHRLSDIDSYDKLKLWFNTIVKASLLNVHMVQPLLQLLTQIPLCYADDVGFFCIVSWF